MAVATFVIGVTDGAGMVIWGTLLQRRVPTEMLGRVSSLDFFVSLAFMPVSFAIVGPLSKVVSMETIFLVAGLAPVVFAAVAMLRGADAPTTSWRTRCARRRRPAAVRAP